MSAATASQAVMGRCWRLRAGKVASGPIAADGLQLPFGPDAGDEIAALACGEQEHPDFRTFTLPMVAALAARIAPWATWYFAPKFARDTFGAGDGNWDAICWYRSDTVMLKSSLTPVHAVRSALHEIWHVLEGHLTPEETAAVARATSGGQQWPGQYWQSQQERAARAFETWAASRMEAPAPRREGTLGRLQDTLSRWCLPRHERVFLDAFDGRIAQRAIGRRRVASARLPAAMRRSG